MGADFASANENGTGEENVQVRLYDPSNALISTQELDHLGAIGFWGFTTDHPTGVLRIEFVGEDATPDIAGGNQFGMDDVVGAAMLAATDTPPVAAPSAVSDVGLAGMGATSYSLMITYTDDSAIDVSTLGATDITISGPGGSLTVNSATPDVGTDGTPRVVTYECTPPGGSWDFADSGTYTVAMVGSEVGDDGTPQFVAANASFATFEVLVGSGFATLFTNMVAFESAIGGAGNIDFMIDFEDYTADADFSAGNPVVDVPSTGPRVATLGHLGPNPFVNNIEVLPYPGFPPQQSPNGSNYAHMFVDGDAGDTVELIFDTPVAAWGAMLLGAANEEDLEIELYDMGGTLLDSLEHNADGFYGFTSPSPGTVKRIVFKAANALGAGTNNPFGMDNMKGAYTYMVNNDPVVASVTAPDVTIPDTGQTSYDIIIEFSDDSAIDVSTLDAGDITVTGPGAIGTLTVTGVTEPTGTDGTPRFATYTVTPPGGSWDLADNGTYTIAINGNEVFDDTADPVAADASVDTFVVEARSNVVTDFTSKAAWTTAIGGTPDWAEDFEAFGAGLHPFDTTPVVSPTPGGGNFSVVRVGGASTFGNFVDADPANNVGEETSAPIINAAMFVEADAGLTVEMTFDNPVLGWIGEFFTGVPEEDIEIEVHDAGGIIDLLEVNANGYLGFTVPTATVTKLVFRGAAPNLSSGGEVFGLDNICAHETPIGPEIDVTGNGMSIAGDGSNVPSAADDTDFGSVECAIDPAVVHTFTILNTGAELNLTGTPPNLVVLSGSSDFSVTQQPTTPVAATTGMTTFDITFTPSSAGVKTAIVSIASDDPDEDPYTFNIEGTGTDTTPPVIVLSGDNPLDVECAIETYVDPGFTATDDCDGNLTASVIVDDSAVDENTPGMYNVTYNVTDAAGNMATEVIRVVNVEDTIDPVISGAKDIVVTAPAGGPSAPVTYNLSVFDACDPSVTIACMPMSGSTFPIGVTTVNCSATDSSGNTGNASFDVIVLEIQETPRSRVLTGVSIRGDSVTGATGTVNAINRAYLNNAGTVVFSSSMSGVGANSVVARGPINGPHTAVAIRGTASGVGDFGDFSDLAMNDSGNVAFASRVVPNNLGHFVNLAGGAGSTTNTAVKDGVAPTGGGETYRSLQKPAIASNGQVLTRANLNLGGPVTSANDTVITSSAGAVIAREGDPTTIGGGVLYSGLFPRVVTSENNSRYAFTANLKPVSSLANTGLFASLLTGGPPQLVVREGDIAAGTGGGAFSTFLGESINSSGEIVTRANVRGAGISTTNNEGIWTTVGNVGGSPSLIAREGGITPCVPPPLLGLIAFDRFTTIGIGDDGSVCFFAYLKNATAAPVVNSTNDGSIWRWTVAGGLHLIAREGDLANNTDGAGIARITGFACSSAGGVVYGVEYVQNQGDYTSTNRNGIYLDRGVPDAAPELIMRRGDKFTFMGTERTVSSAKVSFEENSGHGTCAGYGRSIDDSGNVLLNMSLGGNLSGIFVLGP